MRIRQAVIAASSIALILGSIPQTAHAACSTATGMAACGIGTSVTARTSTTRTTTVRRSYSTGGRPAAVGYGRSNSGVGRPAARSTGPVVPPGVVFATLVSEGRLQDALLWNLINTPRPGAAPAASGAPAAPTLTVEQLFTIVSTTAAQATANLDLPRTPPVVEPDPTANEWKMAAVGQPLWFHTADPDSTGTAVDSNGIAIQITGTRAATTLDFGDGTTLRCTSMTPRPSSAAPMAKSPDCGHTYTRHGTYTITATTTWDVSWQALGFTGTNTQTRTSSTTLDVGQLAAVVVK